MLPTVTMTAANRRTRAGQVEATDLGFPGVLARIRPQLAACGQKGRHAQQASQRHVPAELNVAGHAAEAVFIEQMAPASRRDRHDAAKPG